jgi:acyl carrier protein phosphodiesterase
MNFLAHLYLSGENKKIMVGNFIADFVKGRKALEQFDPGIVEGIELHRNIDSFTDLHAIVKRSKDRLRPKHLHFSGVIVDIFYDHFLAVNWRRFHPEPLEEFASQAYRVVQDEEAILPEEVKRMLPYMIRGNWLVNYGKIEGVSRALSGMASRSAYPSRMDEAGGDLRENYPAFEKEFLEFFPLLRAYVATLRP